VELENWFLLKYIESYRPKSTIDIGCGNGRRTVFLSEHIDGRILGVDFSEIAIRHARLLESDRIRFEQWDLENKPRRWKSFDCVLACRVLINLQSHRAQVTAIRRMADLLKDGGILLLSEASEQGHEALNGLRNCLSLRPTNTVWHNLLLDEVAILKELKRQFTILETTRFGLYFLLTNVIHSPVLEGRQNTESGAMAKMAVVLQKRLYVQSKSLDHYGEHLGIAAVKRRS
jgi:SAM-dependent methyltransferase